MSSGAGALTTSRDAGPTRLARLVSNSLGRSEEKPRLAESGVRQSWGTTNAARAPREGARGGSWEVGSRQHPGPRARGVRAPLFLPPADTPSYSLHPPGSGENLIGSPGARSSPGPMSNGPGPLGKRGGLRGWSCCDSQSGQGGSQARVAAFRNGQEPRKVCTRLSGAGLCFGVPSPASLRTFTFWLDCRCPLFPGQPDPKGLHHPGRALRKSFN